MFVYLHSGNVFLAHKQISQISLHMKLWQHTAVSLYCIEYMQTGLSIMLRLSLKNIQLLILYQIDP